jgi:hypothetical protein
VILVPEMKPDTADAAELAEMLQFLSGWLARDPARLGASLAQFVGHPAYGLGELRGDLERFVFLLGGSDGEPPVRPPAAMTGQAPRPAEDTPGLTGINVVRPRAARCGRSTLTPPQHRRHWHLSGEASTTPALLACAKSVAVTSGRERDRRWQAAVLASGITEPLIHVADRLTQVTLIVVGGQQALLHKSLRDFTGGLLVEVAGPDRPLKDRQNPDQDLGITMPHRVRRRTNRVGSHDTTMPRAYHLALEDAVPRAGPPPGETLPQATQNI